VENFGGDLELKQLDLTWSGQVDSVDLTVATLRSTMNIMHEQMNKQTNKQRNTIPASTDHHVDRAEERASGVLKVLLK